MAESSPEPQVSTKDLLKDENRRKEAIDEIRRWVTKEITETDPQKRAEAISKLPAEKKVALSQEWMKKANFTESMTQKAYAKLWLNKDSGPEEIIKAVSKYQEENDLAEKGKWDGILGWKTLESLDAAISQDDTDTDSKEDKKNKNAGADDKIKGFDRAKYYWENKNKPISLIDFARKNTNYDLKLWELQYLQSAYSAESEIWKNIKSVLPEINLILWKNPEMENFTLTDYTLIKEDPYSFGLQQANKTNNNTITPLKIPGTENLWYIVNIEDWSKKVVVWKIASNWFLEQEDKRIYINWKEVEKV